MTGRALLVALGLAWPLAAGARDRGELRIYPTHGQPDRLFVQGRFLEAEGHALLKLGHGQAANLLRAARELKSEEIEGATIQVEVAGQTFRAVTDDDGVFRVEVALVGTALPPGPTKVVARALDDRGHPAAPAEGVVYILPAGPSVAVISDFDDTVAISGITSKRAMLKNALLKDATDLEPVPGGAEAYRRAVAAGAAAVFYVSGSPQNFLNRIKTFLELRGFPAGPLELKNFGTDPTFDQVTYKRGRLEGVLAAHPQTRFVLVGDSGERDPEIFRAVQAAHPGRILGIVIRLAPGGDHGLARLEGLTTVHDFAGDPDVLARLLHPTP